LSLHRASPSANPPGLSAEALAEEGGRVPPFAEQLQLADTLVESAIHAAHFFFVSSHDFQAMSLWLKMNHGVWYKVHHKKRRRRV
jgi:hypothetical protein